MSCILAVTEVFKFEVAALYILYDNGSSCNAFTVVGHELWRTVVPPFEIENLVWDDENDEHVSRHVSPTVAQSMFEANDWIIARNKRHQPADRIRLIGRTLGGEFLTVVIAPTSNTRVWRPVSAYASEPGEVQLFERTKRRQR